MLAEYRIHNADVHLKGDYDVDDLVDVIEGNRIYVPCIYVINKIDQVCRIGGDGLMPGGSPPESVPRSGISTVSRVSPSQITLEELNVLDRLPHYCPVCAYHEWNLDGLVEMIWEYLDLLRIYTKPKVCWGRVGRGVQGWQRDQA